MTNPGRFVLFPVAMTIALALSGVAQAEEPTEAEKLAQQLSNPVADLVSIPFQFNWEEGVGVDHDVRFILNVQPVVPFSISKDWNVIGRMIVPVISQPPLVPGGETTFGTGDIVASAFFSPKESKLVWGVGPVFGLPATSDPNLGSGKWSVGPTAVVLKQSGPWTYGALANQLWSFADTGNVDREPVSQMFLQPFVAYGTKNAVTYTLQSETTANWRADSDQRWTIPINVLVSKVTKLGPFPFSIGAGAGYFLESPDASGARWKLRAVFTLILPRAKA